MVDCEWEVQGSSWKPLPLPRVMGILNVTPDSFSDGGRHSTIDKALQSALQMVEDGADVIDVGGESSRPGAAPVSESEELRRVLPLIERLRDASEVAISIDTTKAAVAAKAIEAGATIVNDISGLRFDPGMPDVCAESKVGVVCMHMQGNPGTMQDNPSYESCVSEICDFFAGRLEELQGRGIPERRVCLDPGVGFGKTAAHNIEILKAVRDFRALGRPVLIGHSRKRFIASVLGRDVEERLAGTIGVSVALAEQGVDWIRVHDVRAVRDTLLAWQATRAH